MQDPESVEIVSINTEEERSSSPISSFEMKPNDVDAAEAAASFEEEEEEESIEDVSGKTVELSVSGNSSSKALYMYKNTFNLIPRSIKDLEGLKTLKFFANEINLFPLETGNLCDLENLQVKLSSPVVSGLPLQNLKSLKELELFKIPPRSNSAFPLLLSEIAANLKCLKKLVFCHFSVKYLPPEIGCLVMLEELDVSFNKLKSLPEEITCLSSLVSLRVANNKLEGLPRGLSLLRKLETLDLSNNRLTSLGSLDLAAMETLRTLDLQYNKLFDCCDCEIPSWVCCNLEGNGKDVLNDGFSGCSSVSTLSSKDDQSNGSSAETRITRRWRRRRACQEGLNNSTVNRKCDDHQNMNVDECSNLSSIEECESSIVKEYGGSDKDLNQTSNDQQHMNVDECKTEVAHELLSKSTSSSVAECESSSANDNKDSDMNLEQTINDQQQIQQQMNVDERKTEVAPELLTESCSSSVVECESRSIKDYDTSHECDLDLEILPQSLHVDDEDENLIVDVVAPNKGCESRHDALTDSSLIKCDEQVGESSMNANASKSTPKIKRQVEDDVENPKPRKSLKPFESSSYISNKYSTESFCSADDRLPDGFYDAGRARPFMPLESYDQSFCLDSREVILVDREMDDVLDVMTSSAKELLFRSKQTTSMVELREHFADDDLRRASVVALFVSNWFGGNDRSNLAVKTRKAWSGSNYQKPFVCTCPTGNGDSSVSSKHIFGSDESVELVDLCDKNLRNIKQARKSNIVPIGNLQWGVCRHRAVLMKYLCDRMLPPIPCELVRGYLDFSSHAWNVVPVTRNGSSVRMIVDACCPTDIREETDPEYFCRYIPSSRIYVPITSEDVEKPNCSFPSSSQCQKVETTSSSLLRYSFGSVKAVAKVRTLNTSRVSDAEVKKLEYDCLGEVRMLGALKKHPCIVEMIGHQISSKWVPSVDGDKECRVLQSAIWMEYIEGGTLKSYIEKISKNGEKCVQVELALFIARDIACALAELHSKHIIHRDIKSENILIDLDRKRADGTPVVKLCDFDRAVPLRSSSHTCCIGHHGIPPPNICVGTPRWMAPEVVETVNQPKMYGLEIDIWSYGCVLLELLTLEAPFAALPSSNIHDLLKAGQRPPLTGKLEALVSEDEPALAKTCAELAGVEAETEILRLLVYLFRQCTRRNPKDRPTAAHLYQKLTACIDSLASSTK